MMTRIAPTLALLAAFLLSTAPAEAQVPQPQMPDSVQEMIQEFQELQQRLTSLQQQALSESEGLQDRQAEVQETVEEAMLDINPDLEGDFDRMEDLQGEMQQAQAAEDQGRMQEIAQEAQGIQGRIEQAQAEAMERDPVMEKIETFREALMEEMTDLDPEAEEIMERLERLAERIEDAMDGAQPQPR